MFKHQIISFFGLEQGCGKTTNCLFFALNLIKQNFKVLLIDFDTKSDLTKFFQKNSKNDNLYKYLEEEKEFKNIIYKNILNNLDLVNVSYDTAYLISSKWNATYTSKLVTLLHSLKEEYDFILIDLSNINNYQNKLIISLSDALIWIINVKKDIDKQINHGMKMINEIKNSFKTNFVINGILMNFFDTNDTLNIKDYSEIVKIFNNDLYNTHIKSLKSLVTLINIEQLINTKFNKDNELDEFKQVVKEFIDKNTKKED